MVQNQLFIHEGFLGEHGKDRILYTFPPVYVYKVNVMHLYVQTLHIYFNSEGLVHMPRLQQSTVDNTT